MMGRFLALLCAIVVSIAFAACGGSSPQPSGSAQPGSSAPPPTDTANGPGVITGTVTFAGTAPPPRPLRMESDSKCTPEPGATSEVLLVGPANGLQNVFVYVKDGLGSRRYAVPTTPVLLDQRGCRYIPHVFGVQVGQPVQIANSDPALHNVNSTPKVNRGFNFGQAPTTPAVTRTFDSAEIGVPFRCDVHSWMNAYAGVVAHPFFAVTESDGTFEIKGLPTGTYTIELWHEQLGTQTQTVTVDGQAPAKLSASFKEAT